MRACSTWYRGLLLLTMGVALAACDPGEEGETDGGGGIGGGGGTGGGGGRPPDAGRMDAPAGGTAYKYIAIFDDEKIAVCTGTGPGADIDSIDLVRGTQVIGVGLRASAVFSEGQPGTTNDPCETCGSAMTNCKYSGATVAARAEGIPDGKVNESTDDIGYIALNGGLLWLQIGQLNGNSPVQDIQSGDKIVVHEVDKSYIAEGSAFAGCLCAPEKYAVYAYGQMGMPATRIQLKPVKFRAENMATCGTAPSATETLGCGTTEFTVP
jgi:hypothetical protein